MSETQVFDVTTTIKKEIKPLEEEIVEATTHLDSTELSGTTSRSTDEDKHHDDYLVGGNSEAVSITSSKLLEEYPSSHYLKERASLAQISAVTFEINSTSEKELLEKFGQCTECGQANSGEENWCRSCSSVHFRSQFDNWSSGNENLNKILRDTQLSARSSKYVLEWIPYNKFRDVKYVSKGGFGT
ncbi:2194_t:CDS:1, partial [Funneliformis geosporum]